MLAEVHKVLEAGVEVGFFAEAAYLVEVRVVHVRVHAVEAFADGAHALDEVPGEGSPEPLRENRLVVQLRLHPLHEVLDVVRGGALYRLLHLRNTPACSLAAA
eukprot:CAMPEP_0114256954 /NCGR_PEP_ID=MMETSP0058-20121206/18457_1 /TAXON_ID=36894 /ORGANISM="Pyramimonas parkeae, CCMP726" /LENGTH=102 /DNA_ID=CAMNT_0001371613 /DNA_START=686 /DNA_END=990 /DNA_ORIENTATION=+